jgi:hypothetical protein
VEKFKTILVLNNEVEARLLDVVIPCLRRPPATTAGVGSLRIAKVQRTNLVNLQGLESR